MQLANLSITVVILSRGDLYTKQVLNPLVNE